MGMRKVILSALALLIFGTSVKAQHPKLRQEIALIAKSASGKVGVAINLLETNDTLTYHNQDRYVLHSVGKLAIAMTVLNEVDKGKFKINQLIHITKEDLPPTHSPLRDKYPNGNVNVPIDTLLAYMVSFSDNDACDILLKKLSGTDRVEKFVHDLGVKEFAMKASEANMASEWPVQYGNYCQPGTQIDLLKMTYHGNVLSKTSSAFLLKALFATNTGPNRLKGLLPKGTAVAHKTGTSPTNTLGLSPATNDVGIIVLPNGKHLAISVFLSDSKALTASRELVIAKIAKAAYDEFARK